MDYNEVNRTCAKFWFNMFTVILLVGAGIGFVGKHYVKTPPYITLIQSNNKKIVDSVKLLSDRIDSIDTRVTKLEQE